MKQISALIKRWDFESVSNRITNKVFPIPDRISKDYRLFNFNTNVSSEEAIERMRMEGYKPANAYELLCWKKWHGSHAVVALGSRGGCLILYRKSNSRNLTVAYDGEGMNRISWHAQYSFLGVK